jgi:phosphate transport system protein
MLHGLRSTFDREYCEICDDLVQMSQMVDWAIEHAMLALTERDTQLAQEVIANDEKVNAIRFKIEEACLVAIATQQPTASDLRAVVTAIHIVVDMERIGDHAAGIAKSVILLYEEPLVKTFKKILKMGEFSRQMLNDCIQAFVKRDADWAREIAERDNEMDQMYKAVFQRLIEVMAKKPDLVTPGTYLMWCAHNLERIADRVTNIAERIIFMTTGDLKELNIKIESPKGIERP